ncbi:MAG: rRNA maturation RNase YbeY [Patescibacteria group bacterium]|nr:rRNA maturation RNase YbeY [Patescibacteria group bacterium]
MDAKGNILLFAESRYKVNRKRIKSVINKVLREQGVVSPFEISVSIVGDRKMRALNKKYRDKDQTTNILSFPLGEGKDSGLPEDVLYLGDVVISYPQVIKEAAAQEVLVDERIDELVEHGLMHLLGINHE